MQFGKKQKEEGKSHKKQLRGLKKVQKPYSTSILPHQMSSNPKNPKFKKKNSHRF